MIVELYSISIDILQAAFVERLDGRDLFDSLYAEDVEGQKLNTMPGVPELHEEYGKKFQGESKTFCSQIKRHWK